MFNATRRAIATVVSVVVIAAACDDPVGPRQPARAVAISAFGNHTCVVTDRGEIVCWGENYEGQSGPGLSGDYISPTAVPLGRMSGVALGFTHSCSFDNAGDAWCWGHNGFGQTGTGTAGVTGGPYELPQPTEVAGTVRFVELTGGHEHTCGRTTSGTVYCWGHAGFGQTGEVVAPPEATPSPFLVPGGFTFVDVAAGNYFNCGVVTDGRVYCWGRYHSSSGLVEYRNTPTLHIDTPRFRSIEGGADHMCGVAVDDEVYCWGANNSGVLGLDPAVTPATAQPLRPSGNHRFVSVSAGITHTCAIRTDQRALCWGRGVSGQLGHGALTSSFTPVEVAGGHQFTSLSTGFLHTCGITTAGEVFCWGRLRDAAGDTISSVPVRIALP